jgi:hypothetical protein
MDADRSLLQEHRPESPHQLRLEGREPVDHLPELLAAHRVDLELGAIGLGSERRVVQRRPEGLAEGLTVTPKERGVVEAFWDPRLYEPVAVRGMLEQLVTPTSPSPSWLPGSGPSRG